ncbi:Hypothetical protein PHPALM_1041 [Phytophthora palmivora]|uniref:Integrase zinc-binding domain-containing protein n=1 Tax=Phytophthora palmivora TaxID=4796 RepID=A0A2P4YTB3_9STRA|nr:Hypothetical protein PHPALM_1041 [Phytophthora palmivora]
MPTWYFFAPHDALNKHVRDRLQRWAMRLCGLRYTIEHIAGKNNIWTDIISRWHTREVVRAAAVQTRSQRAAPLAAISPLRPMFDVVIVSPTLDDIREAQHTAGPENSRLRITLKGGTVSELLARIFVVAHTGAQGHRGQEPMITSLQRHFGLARITEKEPAFIRECLLCKHVKGPRIIPQSYGPSHRATSRKEALHWDLFSLGSG